MAKTKLPAGAQKIGSGLQYHVYDLGNGRVLKLTRPLKERVAVCRDWGKRHWQYAGDRGMKHAKRAEKSLTHSIRQLEKRKLTIDPAFLGNPVFFPDGSYEQDRVTMLEEYLTTHSLQENKQALADFISAVLQQWEYHFCEWTFKFDINFGINRDGRVILADLGELHFARSKVAEMIKHKLWLRSYSFQRLEEGPLKEYYKQETAKRLTEETFNKLWPKKAHTL